MKLAMSFAFAIAMTVALALATETRADDKKAEPAKGAPAPAPAPAKPAGKEVTLKGTMGCGKCAYKETKECQNVLKVKEGKKVVKYLMVQNDVSKENHSEICSGPKPATVKGSVSEESGKKVLTASEIKFE